MPQGPPRRGPSTGTLTDTLQVRLTPAEKAAARASAAAAGIRLSELVRMRLSVAGNDGLARRELVDELTQLRQQLRRVGVNLNSLVHNAQLVRLGTLSPEVLPSADALIGEIADLVRSIAQHPVIVDAGGRP